MMEVALKQQKKWGGERKGEEKGGKVTRRR
jgi:hypothetical protein